MAQTDRWRLHIHLTSGQTVKTRVCEDFTITRNGPVIAHVTMTNISPPKQGERFVDIETVPMERVSVIEVEKVI